MNVDIQKIEDLGKDVFMTKISNIAAKTQGQLIVKEYPTGSAHSGHFRGLLDELKTKKDFVPEIIFIDYIGICASARTKLGGSVNSYSYLKAISEEMRGLATEFDVPVVTAGQVNRSAFGNSEMELSNISDSMAIVHTADLILGVIRTDELTELGQILIKQLKNRYADVNYYKRFVVGLNASKMKLFNLEVSAQSNITQTTSTFTAPVVSPSKQVSVTDDFIF